MRKPGVFSAWARRENAVDYAASLPGTELEYSPHVTRTGVGGDAGKYRSLLANTSGAVFLEHLTLLSLCGLVTAALLLAIGAFKVRVYSAQREALYQPYP